MARRPRPGLRFDGAPWIRASDADRERAADFLRGHCAEGRLTLPELEQRLQVALSAWTIGDLEALTTDLPGGTVAPAGGRAMSPRRRPGRSLALKIVGVVALLWVFGQALAGLSEFAAWALGMVALSLFIVVCAAAFTIASVAFVVRGTEQLVRRVFDPPRPRPPAHWA